MKAKSPPQAVKLMETWFQRPNPEMERRATQSSPVRLFLLSGLFGERSTSGRQKRTGMNETSTFFGLFARGAYRGIQLDREGLKRLKLKLLEMDGAIPHYKVLLGGIRIRSG